MNSNDFSQLQTSYAVGWVVDCVSQCRRLCCDNLDPGPYRFLRGEDIVRAVQARRDSGTTEDEDEDEDDVSAEDDTTDPQQPTPGVDASADTPAADLPAGPSA